MQEKWDNAQNGGKKSFNYKELDDKFIIKKEPNILIPYLNAIKIVLEEEII